LIAHFTLFVGDLSGDVSDKVLQKAFSAYGEVTFVDFLLGVALSSSNFSVDSDARVMMDPNTGRSRGYGFISFRAKYEAENAMAQMNGIIFTRRVLSYLILCYYEGEWLGSRAIRVNWANTKNQSQASTPVSTLPVVQDLSDPSAEYDSSIVLILRSLLALSACLISTVSLTILV
jgi:nucleolysin TIA-1/TIAR